MSFSEREYGTKGGLGRQVWPDRFSDAPWLGRSAQVSVELPEDRGVARHADWLSARLARQPGNRRAIKLPAAISWPRTRSESDRTRAT